jgi:cell division protein FtsI/penicillin-binding protein 2
MSFIAFLPAADPQIIVLVKLVQPKLGAWAEDVTIPVFDEVAQSAVQILNITPDDREPP